MSAGSRSQRRFSKGRRPRGVDLRLVGAAVALLGSALPSAAELVVFSSGHVLKAEAVRLVGDTLRLSLPGGGALAVPLSVIERVVDDEVVEQPDPLDTVDVQLRFLPSAGVPDTPFGSLIYEAARSQDVSPTLVAAMVRAESAFDPGAVSHKGARGLLQVMPATARRFGVAPDALFDPGQNLTAGTRYISWLQDRYPDDLPRILAAYNAGEGNVDRYRGVPPFRETRTYIRRVYSSLGLDPGGPPNATR